MIRRRVGQISQIGVEHQMRRNLLREAVLQAGEEPFVFFLARAQHGQLHAPLQQPLGNVAEQVDALVPSEARHHDEQRRVLVLGRPSLCWSASLLAVLPSRMVFML